ncbi:MAG: response regulator [Lachnospiraceae bacterium]|nr:response regulator [Lachnospiraceae bacterium]
MDKMNFLSNLTVLLVEDDADALRQMEIMLRRRCGKTYLANNGMVGFKTWERVRPDVVVTDLKMPVMGGLEMSRRIRETDKDIPIIITTAFDDRDIILKAIDVGINKYIVKPIDARDLLGALSEVSAQVLRLQDGIFTGGGLIVDREEKLKKEADIKQIFAAMLKEETGKGPQIIRSFIQGAQIRITLESVLTKMEQSLVSNEKNYHMVNYAREVFYLDRRESMEEALSAVLDMEVTLKKVGCDARANMDTLQFELKIY